MVWAGEDRSCVRYGTLNAQKYRQDNGDTARPHDARDNMDYLRHYNIDVLPWPAQSPDLSTI